MNTEGAIKNRQSRETGNIGYTGRRETKQNHNTIHVEQLYKCTYKQTQVTQIRHEPSNKQLEVKKTGRKMLRNVT
jgi:hypothetical protein